jgi:hypothetical protein
MGEDLVAESSSTDLWLGLDGLWEAVYRHGQRDKLAMPVVGSGLARIDPLDQASLIRLICLSFIAASRQHLLTHHLTVLMPEPAFHARSAEVQAFLDSPATGRAHRRGRTPHQISDALWHPPHDRQW